MNWQTLSEHQKKAARVLRHAVRRGELAHAYLLEGPKGTGKRQAAMLLAQTLFCEKPRDGEPCLDCRNCRRVASGNHPDVIWVRLEENAATIKKDQIARLIKEFAYRGVESAQKMFIIEDAEKMTVQAENSLLKFIEEPYPGTHALLITEHMHQLLDTIISRCQVLTFVPLSVEAVARRLIEDNQPPHLARIAAALTQDYEEAVALCRDEWIADARALVLQLVQRLHKSSEPALPLLYEKFSLNFDNQQRTAVGLDMLLFWYRDILSLHVGRPKAVVYSDQLDTLKDQALRLSESRSVQAMSLVLDARKRLDAHVNGLSVWEQLVIRLGGLITA
ncbi:DNA polymerase III subunit delta' [Sporolactobacillus sp. THM7-7]|nr:DNA polymerase III subunit delta' [Sporolactobacillus sp. THM7-7]